MLPADSLERFADMEPAIVGQLAREIALLGRQGLEITNPDKSYQLTNLAGEFSGLHLISLMHAGIRQFAPNAEAGTDLDRSTSGKAA